MIILSFECPGEVIAKYDRYNDYYFVIPELLEDPLYFEFIKNTNKYIMLDNGMYESGFPDIDNLLDNARAIGAREVVLPDFLYETEKTREATGRFIDSLGKDELKEFRWMLVIQAQTINQWVQTYQDFNEEFSEHTYSIGIPRCPHKPLYFRTVAMQTLRERGLAIDKPHHMLGMNDPSELLYLGFVRSCDTGWPFKKDKHKDILRRINLLRKLARQE